MTRRLSHQARAVLDALAEEGRWVHGYELSRRTQVQPGTLYPLLERLAGRGWLEARWEESPAAGRPRRHVYRLTPAGIDGLAQATQSRVRTIGVTLSPSVGTV